MLQVFPREKRAVIRADVLISAAAISSAKRFAQIEVVTDSPLEEAGFEPWVPDEGKPSHASITFDRYRRHSGRSDTCARRPVAIAIRADTVAGGIRYSANLQCPRLSDRAVCEQNKNRG